MLLRKLLGRMRVVVALRGLPAALSVSYQVDCGILLLECRKCGLDCWSKKKGGYVCWNMYAVRYTGGICMRSEPGRRAGAARHSRIQEYVSGQRCRMYNIHVYIYTYTYIYIRARARAHTHTHTHTHTCIFILHLEHILLYHALRSREDHMLVSGIQYVFPFFLGYRNMEMGNAVSQKTNQCKKKINQ